MYRFRCGTESHAVRLASQGPVLWSSGINAPHDLHPTACLWVHTPRGSSWKLSEGTLPLQPLPLPLPPLPLPPLPRPALSRPPLALSMPPPALSFRPCPHQLHVPQRPPSHSSHASIPHRESGRTCCAAPRACRSNIATAPRPADSTPYSASRATWGPVPSGEEPTAAMSGGGKRSSKGRAGAGSSVGHSSRAVAGPQVVPLCCASLWRTVYCTQRARGSPRPSAQQPSGNG